MTEHILRAVNRRHGTFGKILFLSRTDGGVSSLDTAAYGGLIQALEVRRASATRSPARWLAVS